MIPTWTWLGPLRRCLPSALISRRGRIHVVISNMVCFGLELIRLLLLQRRGHAHLLHLYPSHKLRTLPAHHQTMTARYSHQLRYRYRHTKQYTSSQSEKVPFLFTSQSITHGDHRCTFSLFLLPLLSYYHYYYYDNHTNRTASLSSI